MQQRIVVNYLVSYIDPQLVVEEIHAARKILPKFPDGRIDYTNALHAPVVNVLVLHDGCILLTHRSDKVGSMQNCWHIPAGYLDEEVSLREKALEELREELGIMEDSVKTMRAMAPARESLDGKSWTVYSVVVELTKRPTLVLDWEHDDARWVSLQEDLTQYQLLASLLHVFAHVRSAIRLDQR